MGIAPTDDPRLIRRAYAKQLKLTRPEEDAEGFAELRAAYEIALGSCVLGAGHSQNVSIVDVVGRSVAVQGGLIEPLEETGVEPLLAKLESMTSLLDHPTPREAQAFFTELLSLPAMTSLAVFTRVEREVARLVLDSLPRSDWLIEPVIDSFRWTREKIGSANPNPERVLQRAQDLRFWRAQANPAFGRHRARRELLTARSDRARRLRALLTPNLTDEVRRLLDLIDFEHTSLLVTVDRGAQHWWREFLEQPRLTGWMVALTLAAPALGFMGARVLAHGLNREQTVLCGVATFFAVAVAFGFWFRIAIPLRKIWRARRGLRAGMVERWGWVPASLLLPVFGEGAFGRVGWPSVAVVAVALSIWCGVSIDFRRESRPAGLNAFYSLLLLYGPIAGWCAVVAAHVATFRTSSMILSMSTAIALNMIALIPLTQWLMSSFSTAFRRIGSAIIILLLVIAYVLCRLNLLVVGDATLSVASFVIFLSVLPLTLVNTVSRSTMFLSSIAALYAGFGFPEYVGNLIRTLASWILAGSALALSAMILAGGNLVKRRRA